MKSTIKSKIMQGFIIVFLILLIAYSFQVKAQLRGRNFGADLSLAVPHFRLQSNITELNHLRTSYLGFNVGGVIANDHSKIKITLGTGTSNDAVPYFIDFFHGGASWSLYFLRMKEAKLHVIEPYFLLGANLMHTRFYGNYLNPDASINYSTSNPPYLGHVGWVFATVGIGFEYQVRNEDLDFISFFGQAAYGASPLRVYTDQVFSKTSALGNVSYTFGVYFTILKY